jgi:DNA methyltransferase 1-associated protein 1
MKLPSSVGQKKSKTIEQLLHDLNIGLNFQYESKFDRDDEKNRHFNVDSQPVPTDETCTHFNELRSDMVLLYELKVALQNCEFELQSLQHQYNILAPGKVICNHIHKIF